MKSEYLAEVKVITIPNYAIGLMFGSVTKIIDVKPMPPITDALSLGLSFNQAMYSV